MKKKKYRLKRQPAIILCICILVFALLLSFGIKYYNTRYERYLKKLGYTSSEIKLLKDNKVSLKTVNNYDYIPVLSSIVENKDFKVENTSKYLDLYQKDRDIDAIIFIVNNNIKYDYSDKLVSIINDDYFILSRLDRYMKYDEETNSRKIVRDINSNMDYDYYLVTTKADVSKEKEMLVNKFYYLDDSYNCVDLVKVENGYANLDGNKMNKEAYEALKELIDDADKEGYHIRINYSYRDYATQEGIYNDYKKNKGEEYADSYAARPGFSEHQTGYSVDVGVQSKYSSGKKFQSTKEYTWMKDNSYKYGFILRYPEGLESQTGYSFEAWHYRYVGKEIASYIYEHGITFDEYYAYFIENK